MKEVAVPFVENRGLGYSSNSPKEVAYSKTK